MYGNDLPHQLADLIYSLSGKKVVEPVSPAKKDMKEEFKKHF